MTANQISYAKFKEDQRHNQAYEQETKRHNVVVEGETGRHNVVVETQGWRDVASREQQARASQTQAQASLLSAKAAKAYNESMVHINRQNAESNLISAQAKAKDAETNAGKINVSILGTGISGSLTGLKDSVFGSALNGLTQIIPGNAFAGSYYDISDKVTGLNLGTP